MNAKGMKRIASSLGLNLKELAHLLGVSGRNIYRGTKPGGTADLLLQALGSGLNNPRSAQSVRALAIIAARGGGLELLLRQLLEAYVTMDLLRLR